VEFLLLTYPEIGGSVGAKRTGPPHSAYVAEEREKQMDTPASVLSKDDLDIFDRLMSLEKDMQRQVEIAEELKAADPNLSDISAIVIAGDKMTAERADTLIKNGIPYKTAVVTIGSFYRLDWAVKQYEKGYITLDTLLANWPEDWRSSDPDDTDKRFLRIWHLAHQMNGHKYVRDGKALPNKKTLVIYRGQDEGAPYGIAWTLDKNIAEKFARGAGTRQANRAGIIYSASVERRKVLGYLTMRGESEVIVNPRDLR
jgi:hypothetical protein